MSDETGLGSQVDLLWGLREAPRRGPRATLSADDITRAAIAVADAEGLAAVSMARVAAELGNSTMALYRHVKSKDELLTLMSDAALESPPEMPAGQDWRAGLMLWAHGVLAALRQHRWYARLPITSPPLGPNNLAWFDSALSALAGTGLREDEKVMIVMGVITYVHGEIRLGLDLAAGYEQKPEAFGRLYGEALARVVDPRRMPALGAVVEAGVFAMDDLLDEADQAEEFDFGLGLYLDGVAAFIERRTSGR
jgi:AcrR family transcriptional regulator